MSENDFLLNVNLCQHPLLQHHLTILRNKCSDAETVRNAIRRVTKFITIEATKTLPLQEVLIETPLIKTNTQNLATIPILIIPILRAGLMMSDTMIDLIPTASVYHVGCYRDEESLKPVTYYNKLPSEIDYNNAKIFVLDPMLATGGTVESVIKILTEMGAKESNINFLSIISSPEGIKNLKKAFKKINIFTGAIDEKLDANGYIIPGLGDAGDRSFGTLV